MSGEDKPRDINTISTTAMSRVVNQVFRDRRNIEPLSLRDMSVLFLYKGHKFTIIDGTFGYGFWVDVDSQPFFRADFNSDSKEKTHLNFLYTMVKSRLSDKLIDEVLGEDFFYET